MIGTPIISNTVLEVVSSNLIPPEDMTEYALTYFIAESISFAILTGTVITPPTITLSGDLSSLAFTPTNTVANTISELPITPKVIHLGGSGTVTLVNTVASTGAYTARIFIHGYFIGK
jgi:hypothetical protein